MRFRNRFPLTTAGAVLVLIAIGAFLRLKNLDFQSLWIDELNTMIQCDPGKSVREMLSYLQTGTDMNPPLYYFIARYWFMLTGYGEYNARLLSAIFGILTISAMYLLGKELYGPRVGLFAAAFTTFNFFNIYYSQEARNYILAFLLVCLSFTFFVRALRNPNWKSGLWYALSTSLLTYTHYYGLVILLSQGVIVLLFLLNSSSLKRFSVCFGGAWLLIVALYTPWIGTALSLSSTTKSFWISRPASDFFVTYFKNYFGGDSLTVFVFIFLLIVFLTGALLQRTKTACGERFVDDPYIFCFVILSTWILVSYLVPFVKSLVSLPLLFGRYTIVTLPAILLVAAIGLDLLPQSFVKMYITVLIASLSIIHLFAYSSHYDRLAKTQFREMTEFVAMENRKQYPVISDRAWQERYYFRVFKASQNFVTTREIPKLTEVWVITGHSGQPLNKKEREILNRDFRVVKSFTGFDTWAKLFSRERISLNLADGKKMGLHHVYSAPEILETEAFELTPGKYKLYINGYGSKIAGAFPKMRLTMNGKHIADFDLGMLEDYVFSFHLSERNRVQFSLQFLDQTGPGDRNIFIKYISIDPENNKVELLYRLNQRQ